MKAWVAEHTGMPSFETPAGKWVLKRDGVIIATGTGVVYFSDVFAPFGRGIEYAVNNETVTLTRIDPGHNMICDAQGRGVARVRVMSDEESFAPGGEVYSPRNGDSPIVRFNSSFAPRKGAISFTTSGATSMDLARFFTVPRELLLLHSAKACVHGVDCPIPSVRRVVVDGEVSARKTARRDIPTVDWDFSYVMKEASDMPYGQAIVSVVTYEEARVRGLNLLSGSYMDILREVAGMP